MKITAADVGKLRKSTGVGMMEAKKALTETDGDFEKAIEYLRTRGSAKAAKKADRTTAEGRVHGYTHTNGRIGVMVEVLCETDFVARNDDFIALCNDIALHITAMAPQYLEREDVPAEIIEKEKNVLKEQLLNEGKPEAMREKILEGKINKFLSGIVLMEQAFIKDEDLTMKEMMDQKVLSLGENMKINRFSRFEIGA